MSRRSKVEVYELLQEVRRQYKDPMIHLRYRVDPFGQPTWCSVWTETAELGEGADEETALLAALSTVPPEERPTST